LDTKARKPNPLAVVLPEEDPYPPPHETKDTAAKTRTAILLKVLFKPGTPQSMKDRFLDAKERIITEPPARFFLTLPGIGNQKVNEVVNSKGFSPCTLVSSVVKEILCRPGWNCAKPPVILYSQ
jgi:hypothetical protein